MGVSSKGWSDDDIYVDSIILSELPLVELLAPIGTWFTPTTEIIIFVARGLDGDNILEAHYPLSIFQRKHLA